HFRSVRGQHCEHPGSAPPMSAVTLRFASGFSHDPLLQLVSDLCRLCAKRRTEMVPPVQVSPLIKTARYSALIVGIIYGKKRYDYLKPIAAEERRIEEEEKKVREEQERIAKQLAEANEDTILK
ncbi:hypothetical protein QTP70_029194, partial [Hemibagrus guttatus]